MPQGFASLLVMSAPAAGGDGAWAARTDSGPMLMRGDIFEGWVDGWVRCGRGEGGL